MIREVYEKVVGQNGTGEFTMEDRAFSQLPTQRVKVQDDGAVLFDLYQHLIISPDTPDELFVRLGDRKYLVSVRKCLKEWKRTCAYQKTAAQLPPTHCLWCNFILVVVLQATGCLQEGKWWPWLLRGVGAGHKTRDDDKPGKPTTSIMLQFH